MSGFVHNSFIFIQMSMLTIMTLFLFFTIRVTDIDGMYGTVYNWYQQKFQVLVFKNKLYN